MTLLRIFPSTSGPSLARVRQTVRLLTTGTRGRDSSEPRRRPKERRRKLRKWISDTGYCSRYQAGELIKRGRIVVNGVEVRDGAYFVEAKDHVEVLLEEGQDAQSSTESGKAVQSLFDFGVDSAELKRRDRATLAWPRLWLAHKVRGEIVTRHDPNGRPTIFERLERM